MVTMTTSKNSTITKKQMLLNFLLQEKMAKLETNTISLQQPPSPTTTMIYVPLHWAQLKYKLTILGPVGPQGTELCLTFRILFWSSLQELHSTKSFKWKGQFWSRFRVYQWLFVLKPVSVAGPQANFYRNLYRSFAWTVTNVIKW